MQLSGTKALVLGLGITGLSTARWLDHLGAEVSAADTRATPPCAAQLAQELPHIRVTTGAFRDETFAGVDLIALSPGIAKADPVIARAVEHGAELVGDIELLARALPVLPPMQVLAITGSNGKSTVTEMTGAMCRSAGLNTVVAGNIGLPVLDAMRDVERDAGQGKPAPQALVLELSSFQLETTASLNADAAACLNLSEDHLDRYAGMADYAAAKARIFHGDGVQVLNREDEWCRGMRLPGRRLATFGLDTPVGADAWGLLDHAGQTWLAQGGERLMRVDEMRVTGLHNAANALAALALARAIDLPYAPLLQALHAFEGLPHRVQKVADIGGVQFFDDSKGTNVGATVAALNGMQQKVVLIAGGDGKGQDFSPLRAAVAGRARAVVLIGRDAPQISATLRGVAVPVLEAVDMDEAVRLGFGAAQAGDAVLLSPACASFDMFRNYEHRAQVFVAAVRNLAVRA